MVGAVALVPNQLWKVGMTDNEKLVQRVAAAIGEANRFNFTVISFPNANWIAEAKAAIAAMKEPTP